MSGRVFFYVQHLLGIGHLARASRIAHALVADGFILKMVTGGAEVDGFPGPGIEHLALPAVLAGKKGFSELVDSEGNAIDDAFKAKRRDLLLSAFEEFRPDIVIIEAFPFGRRQVRFELLPLLEAIHREEKRPLVVTSLRDILQARTKPGRDQESVDLVSRYFDYVLVHGDPAFVRLEESFPKASEIADKVRYTGLVAAPPPAKVEDRFDIVVSAGGGAVGAELLSSALGAARNLDPALTWCLITGPNLAQADVEALEVAKPPNVTITRFRKDFPGLLRNAKLSISQAGYNTVCDIIRAGCRSLLIPFTTGGETEQSERAERLEKPGFATVLTEEELSAEAMSKAVTRALSGSGRYTLDLDLNGAANTARLLRELTQQE